MYRLALRISEITNYNQNFKHAIELSDITRKTNTSTIFITLKSYKHGQGEKIYSITADNNLFYYIKTYLQMRGQMPGQLFIHPIGQSFSRKFILSVLHNDLQNLGIQTKFYNTHSFRIGRTCDLANDGFSDQQIAEMGRWAYNAYLKYIRHNVIYA